jgi:hypothetical protein
MALPYEKPLQVRIITCCCRVVAWSWNLFLGCLELVLDLTWTLLELLCPGVFGPRSCQPLYFVAVRAMWLLTFILVLWLALLVWCVVLLHLICAAIKPKRTNAGQSVEKGINTVESPAPPKLFRKRARHKGCQKKG